MDNELKTKPAWLLKANQQFEAGLPFSDLPVVLDRSAPRSLFKAEIVNGILQVGETRYYLEAELSVDRFIAYQKWESEAAFGVSFKQQMSNWRKVWDFANESRFADIVVLAYNTMQSVVRVDENDLPYLKLCALFLNTENEDRIAFDPIVVDRKIQHWRESGIPMQFFFQLSATLITGFIAAYDQISQGISSRPSRKKDRKKS